MEAPDTSIELVNKPRHPLIKWAIDLAFNNIKSYTKPSILRYAKTRSLQNKKNEWIVCFHDKRPVGFMTFRIIEDDAYIYELHVEPEHQSRSAGSKIWKFCKGLLMGKVNSFVLYAYRKNVRAVSFYLRHGFEINPTGDCSENFYELRYINVQTPEHM